MFGTATHKSCGCPRGCCDCGPAPTKEQVLFDAEVRDVSHELFKLQYMAIFKDSSDRRKRVTNPYHYLDGCSSWKSNFVKAIERPTVRRTIKKIESIHEMYKNKKSYTPKVLCSASTVFIIKFHSYDERAKINSYFKSKFEYEFKETRTYWK